MEPVYTSGWEISHLWKVGGTNAATGQLAKGNETNVKLVPGVGLSLTVPGKRSVVLSLYLVLMLPPSGGQNPDATTFSAVEIHLPDILLGGIIEVDMLLTNVPGTAMSFMTYHADNVKSLGWQDQQGFRMLGETLLTKNAYNSAGMQPAHFDPM